MSREELDVILAFMQIYFLGTIESTSNWDRTLYTTELKNAF